MRIPLFIIGLLLTTPFVVLFVLFYNEIGSDYAVDYDNSTLAIYQDQSELNDLINQSYERATEASSESGGFNILGDYLTTGYNTVKLSAKSLNIFAGMAPNMIMAIPGIQYSGYIIVGTIISIIIVLFVFKLVELLTGREP